MVCNICFSITLQNLLPHHASFMMKPIKQEPFMPPAQGHFRCDTPISVFDDLYDVYKQDVYRYALYLTRNAGEAEDLFQETWLRVAGSINQMQAIRNAKAWIMTIESNVFRDSLRKKKVRNPAGRIHGGPEVPATASGEDHSTRTDVRMAIQQAMEALPAAQRQVFVLKEMEGYKLKEIGKMLRIPLGTVKSLLYRAVRGLRAELTS